MNKSRSQQRFWCLGLCVYCTKLAPIFKIMFGELSPFRHATASAPQHARGRAVPLLLCRTALAYTLPMLFLFCRDSDFLFFGMGMVWRGTGFSLREKLAEFTLW